MSKKNIIKKAWNIVKVPFIFVGWLFSKNAKDW